MRIQCSSEECRLKCSRARAIRRPPGEVKGYFDTYPSCVHYDLGFIMSDVEWKLVGINVDLKKPDK